MHFKKIVFFNVLMLSSTLSSLASGQEVKYNQWFTGPLFAPMAITPEKEHPGLEVTFGVKSQYGVYNSNWKVDSSPNLYSFYNYYDAQLGISKILGLELIASWTVNTRKGATFTHIQDTIARLGFQLCNEVPGTWVPDFRILLQEVFPTGNYSNLNPINNGTDLTGLGSFQTGIYLAFQKLFTLDHHHKYQMRFSAGYFVPAPVSISGFNAYGGGTETRGTAYPGHYISLFCSGEYSLNSRWALAFDSSFQYNFKGRFSGDLGRGPFGNIANSTPLESAQLTLAPELEHTFSENTGMLLGVWFSLLGKNTPAFASVFFSYLKVF